MLLQLKKPITFWQLKPSMHMSMWSHAAWQAMSTPPVLDEVVTLTLVVVAVDTLLETGGTPPVPTLDDTTVVPVPTVAPPWPPVPMVPADSMLLPQPANHATAPTVAKHIEAKTAARIRRTPPRPLGTQFDRYPPGSPRRKRFPYERVRLGAPMAADSMHAGKFSPRALVLDMDGLMVDSEPLWFQVESAFAAGRGGVWTHEHARAAIGRGTAYTLRTMSALFGFPVDVPRDKDAIFDAFIARVGDLALMPGCLELLDAAEEGGVPSAVASSSPARLIEAVLARFGLRERFVAVISGESVTSPKPAPDVFLRAAELLGAAPSTCAVLEDSLAGATAGRAAGMFVIAVPERNAEKLRFDTVADRIVGDLFAAREVLDLTHRTRVDGRSPPVEGRGSGRARRPTPRTPRS
jgi:sugar-phosphatase